MTSTSGANPSDRKGGLSSASLILIMFLLGIVGLSIFRWKEKDVFPSASIDLRIPKEEILRQAEDLAKKFGYQKTDVIKSISFADDDEGKTFLEYELGNATANELMRETVPIFFWNCKFRKQFDQEKMDIDLSPTGKLLAYGFDLPNDKALPSISHDEAKKMALAFVKENTGWTDEDIKLVEDDTTTCPHRVDHSFTWEYQKQDWKGGKLWSKAQVSGNQLTTFNKYLHRPEEWDRKYSTVRSNNDLLYSIAEIFYVLIYIASMFIFFDALPKKNVRWKFALMLAGFCALLFAADQFNSLPDALAEYNPEKSYSSFVTQTILSILGQIPMVFVLALILGGTSEIVYRTTFGKKIALEKLFSLESLRSKETIQGLLIGCAAFAVSLGYQICYYWLGERANYWCPLSLDNYQLLTSTFPSLSAFSLGFFASGSEEVLYRVIMFALVRRVVGNFWLANLLQAAAWGFMHSNYPQQPAYARGIELTLEGMFNGWMLQRFGLLACFVSHYLFDAFCTVLPLWQSPNLYQNLSAWVPLVPVIFIILGGVYLRKKSGEPDEDALSNHSIPMHEAKHGPKREITPFVYSPLSAKWRYTLAALAILAPIALHFVKPTTQIYTHPKPLQIAREQAVSNARKYLTDLHIDLTGYQTSTAVYSGVFQGSQEWQYIYEKEGFRKADELAQEIEHSFKWTVRFFKPLEPTEYEIILDEDGKVISQTFTKDEDAPGAKLTQAEAVKLSEDFLTEHRKVYSPLVFDNAKVQNRKNRIDYNLTFKVPRFKVADADFIVTQEIIGGAPSSVSHRWKIPDQWIWEKEKQTKKDEICQPIRLTFSAIVLIAIIWWIISLFRHHFVKWRIPFMFGAAAAVILCVQAVNFLPGYFNLYKISMPMQTYIIVSAVAFFIGLVFFCAGSMFGIAVAWGGIKSDWHKDRIEGALRLASPLGEENTFKTRRDMFLDAIILALIYAASLDVLSVCTSIAKFQFGHSVQVNMDYQSLGMMANCLWPFLNIITSTFQSTLFVPLTVAAAFGIATKYKITKFWRYSLFCLALFALIGSSERHWQDFLIDLITGMISATAFWLFLTKALDRNVLSIIVVVWLASLVPNMRIVYKYGLRLFPLELAIAGALALIPFMYLLYLHWRVWKKPQENEAE